MSTAFAWFTLAGEKEDVGGELAYYDEVPCDREAPSCYQWRFTPYEPLPTGQYTAEVYGVIDRAGLGMEGPYAWSFEVTEEIGGEMRAPAAEAPRAAEPVEVPETVEPAAEEEPLEARAGEGGEIEGGLPGVLYVRTTSCYYFGGQRVAMRQTSSWGENVVYYILGDHLGTTSVVLNADGTFHSEARHYPYGGERWHSGTLPTDYRFTGQRDVGLGLTHMGARFLDTSTPRRVYVTNPRAGMVAVKISDLDPGLWATHCVASSWCVRRGERHT